MLTSGSGGNKSHNIQVLTSGRAEQGSTKAWGLHAKILISWNHHIRACPPASDTEVLSGAPVPLKPRLPEGGRGQVRGIVSPVTHPGPSTAAAPRTHTHLSPLFTGLQWSWLEPARAEDASRKVGTGECRGRCGAGSSWGVACPFPGRLGPLFSDRGWQPLCPEPTQVLRAGITAHLRPPWVAVEGFDISSFLNVLSSLNSSCFHSLALFFSPLAIDLITIVGGVVPSW